MRCIKALSFRLAQIRTSVVAEALKGLEKVVLD